MNKTFAFAIALALLFTAWLRAERRELPLQMNLVTSFDFNSYPTCAAAGRSNCIQAIRFYDADSARLLAEVTVSDSMRGLQRIVGTATVRSIPHRAYAVTVYLDNSGRRQEGAPGPVSEFIDAR